MQCTMCDLFLFKEYVPLILFDIERNAMVWCYVIAITVLCF
jgi:hypothetical protein